MTLVDHNDALLIDKILGRHGVRYLLIGKLAAILLGFDDSTQDIDIFVERSPENRSALMSAVCELGFDLTVERAADIENGADLVQLTNSQYDLDLVFAPRGLKDFESSWVRRVDVEGIPICHPSDLIAIKEALNREKDTEALPSLRAFRNEWLRKRRRQF